MSTLFAELKRRNVFRVATAYLVVSWLTMQVAGSVLPVIEAPDWVAKAILLLLALGLPIALLFAWAFEMTPEGVKKTTEIDADDSITHNTGKKLNVVIIGALVLIIGGMAYERSTVTPSVNTGNTAQVTDKSVAVLPFVNMSDDAEQEWFSDGLTEEILNSLTALPELKVTARTSAFYFKGKGIPIPQVAKELGVAHIVEGSVRRSGDTLRITAQLIRAEDGFHLWSQTYNRPYADTFAVQRDVAEKIAEALNVFLDDDRRKIMFTTGTTNLDAFEAYQKGLAIDEEVHSSDDTDKTLWDANALFDDALKADPNFAAAHYATQDAYAHSLSPDDPYVTPLSADKIGLTPEGAIIKLHAIMDSAIKYSKTDAARTAYQMEKAFFSQNWSNMAPLVEKIRQNPSLYATQDTDLIEFLFTLGEIEALESATKEKMAVNPFHILNRSARSAYYLNTGNCLALDDFIVETTRLFGENRLLNYQMMCHVRAGDTGAIEKWLNDNESTSTRSGYKEIARLVTGEAASSIDISEMPSYVKVMFWHLAGDKAAANKAAGALDQDMLNGAGSMSLIVMRYGLPMPFEAASTPNHVRRLRQAGLSEEKIKSMFLPSARGDE